MRIAIVNDVPIAVEAMRRVLEEGGHELAWVAHDGAGAVVACIRNRPDLVLMDLIMPKLDGVEALLAKIDRLGKLVGADDPRPGCLPRLRRKPHYPDCLVAMGASAGGPAALAYVLRRLPAGFPAAMVIVQHVGPQFVPGLASWLDRQTPLAASTPPLESKVRVHDYV